MPCFSRCLLSFGHKKVFPLPNIKKSLPLLYYVSQHPSEDTYRYFSFRFANRLEIRLQFFSSWASKCLTPKKATVTLSDQTHDHPVLHGGGVKYLWYGSFLRSSLHSSTLSAIYIWALALTFSSEQLWIFEEFPAGTTFVPFPPCISPPSGQDKESNRIAFHEEYFFEMRKTTEVSKNAKEIPGKRLGTVRTKGRYRGLEARYHDVGLPCHVSCWDSLFQ